MKKIVSLLTAALLLICAFVSTSFAAKEATLTKITAVPEPYPDYYAGTLTSDEWDTAYRKCVDKVTELGIPVTKGACCIICGMDAEYTGSEYDVITFWDGELADYPILSKTYINEEAIPKEKIPFYTLTFESVPETGDNTPIALMAGLLLLSGAALIALRKRTVK